MSTTQRPTTAATYQAGDTFELRGSTYRVANVGPNSAYNIRHGGGDTLVTAQRLNAKGNPVARATFSVRGDQPLGYPNAR